MNDRELLEMAAKAAGVAGKFDPFMGTFRRYVEGQSTFLGDAWSPLTDDGDALRLAVSIPGLNLQWIIAEAWQTHEDQESRMKYVRRTITRAAAEIGRAMSPQ